jgi:transposase
MGRPFQVEIAQSQERLEKDLKQVRTASSKERLQMLYLLKSGQVNSRKELASLLGRDQATITRWLRKYKDDGLKSLLEVKSAPGKVGIVRGLALERLKQRLQEVGGFHSYGQIQQWIQKELGLVIAYKTVYQLVRYELGAKLKVPRPRSLKQHPEAIAQFQKKFL